MFKIAPQFWTSGVGLKSLMCLLQSNFVHLRVG